MKIVKNNRFGGFSISEDVYKELGIKWDGYGFISNEDMGIEDENYYAHRADKKLISAIEKIGLDNASGGMASLLIVDIPENIDWEIEDYDGLETVVEKHKSW